MTNFKEHDGLIFKMLDKPVPLKENDENVLVRFITHGVIGEYVMEHWLDCNQENVPIYVEDVDSDGDVTIWIDENRNEHHCCPFPMFEIIGTLVKEGSKEWRNYQLVQGKCVYHPGDSEYYQASGQGRIIGKLIENNEFNSTWNSDTFMRDDSDGWQIYEPKPEPQYKVGDWVEHKESKEQATIRRIMSYGAIEIEFAYSTESDIYQADDFHNDFRKLKPFEIVVRIGCLSGTIGKSCEPACFLMWHSSPRMGFDYSIIKLSALDKETRELVEGLLEEQDEEKLKGENND